MASKYIPVKFTDVFSPETISYLLEKSPDMMNIDINFVMSEIVRYETKKNLDFHSVFYNHFLIFKPKKL